MTSNRIDAALARAREENRAALVLYLTAGFPDAATTRRLLPVLAASGCDIVELGIPFSDPIADGPTIQNASTVALRAGMTIPGALELLREFRAAHDSTPVVLFGALNPFLRRGLEAMADEAKAAGADGFLAADLPVEESAELRSICQARGMHLVLLAAPTSPDERLRRIGEAASGFLYCIAVKGITGARASVGEDVGPYLARVRAATSVPIALGFGVSKPEHARSLAPHCDAVVVGSALISLVGECMAAGGGDLEERVGAYVRSMAGALRR